MQIRSDFSKRAVVTPAGAEWVPSPMAGVERLMLDRIGEEVARATSLVRYAPRSRFSEHIHDGGEEFLVLEGVFSDASGDFGPGSYVRNPPGSAHAPWSDEGCVIFVKLRQFDASDTARVVARAGDGGWRAEGEGVEIRMLHAYGDERVRLVRLAAGAEWCAEDADGGEEVLVIDGEVTDRDGTCPAWSWLRNPPGQTRRWHSATGATLYVKTGHLSGHL